MRLTGTIAAALALAGCATDGTPPPVSAPAPTEAATITYRTQPCFGTCPVYTIVATPDGEGRFTGTRFTTAAGEHRFALDRAAYDRFAAQLAPFRPEAGEVRYESGSANCGPAPTDMPSIDVSWASPAGETQQLHFYLGCRMANRALAQALQAAPDALPIGDLIGKR